MDLTQRASTWRAANLRGEEYKRFAGWIRPRTNTEQQGWAATLSTGIVLIINCKQCSSVRKGLINFLKILQFLKKILTKNTNSNVNIGLILLICPIPLRCPIWVMKPFNKQFWYLWNKIDWVETFDLKDILWCLTVFLDTGGSQLRRSLSSCSCLTWKCSSRRRSWRREWQLWGRKV